MFKPFLSWFNYFLSQKGTQKDSSVEYPTDVVLADGLRQLPTPLASANFDQNVLAALTKAPASPTRKIAAPRWYLPALGITSVALAAVLPQTRAITQAVIMKGIAPSRVRPSETAPVPETFPMPPHQAWVTSLPSIVRQDGNGTYRIRFNNHSENQYQSSIDGQESNALLTGLDQWGGQSDYDAAVLRHRLMRTYFPNNRDAENHLSSALVMSPPSYKQRWYAPPSPEALVRLADAARQREPENAFFVVTAAALRFEKGQRADATRLIASLPQTRYWNDYSADEAIARFRWETFRSGRSPAFVYQMFHEDTFPINALGSVYLHAASYAAAQEQVGNVEQGIAIRLALFDLATKISRQPRQFVEEANISGLLMTAMAMPGGEAVPNHVRGSLRTTEFRRSPADTAARFQEYLMAHHKSAEAKRVAQVLRVQQERQHSMAGHWLDLSPPKAELDKLRSFWMVLYLLAFSPLVVWSVAGLLTLAWRLPALRRREEFPAWVTIGITLGALCEIVVSVFQQGSPFDGLYHLTELSLIVLAPVLAVLIVGIGYLRLRHPRLIALSAVAAIGGVWFTHVLISALTPLVLRAAEIGTYLTYDELRSPGYPVGHLASLTVLGAGLLVTFALWRKRASMWQIASQHAAQSSIRLGWCLVIAFSLWCAAVTWQENAFTEACIQQRLSDTTLP